MTTRKLTVAAVSASLSTLFLYLCSLAPSAQLALIALASACLCIPVIECGARYALAGAAAAALLSLILIPNKVIVLAYVLLFGYYPVLKLYIERLRRLWLELLIKLTLALVVIAIALAFLISSMPAYPIFALVLAALAVFVIYDAALTLFITFYRDKISRYIKN